MGIVLARIDNRLLHGIVATQWTPLSGASRVMVIDDTVANEPMLKEAMKMGKPMGVSLSIINRETAYTNFQAGKYDAQKVFVVCKSPQIILDLIEIGQPVPELILGGTDMPQGGEDFTKINKRSVVLKEEEPIYRKINHSGTKIVAQFVPKDQPVLLSKTIEL